MILPYIPKEAPTVMTPRVSLIEKYKETMLKHLKIVHPTHTEQALAEAVDRVISTRLVQPKATVITYPSPGNCELVTMPLGNYVKSTNSYILTPSGTAFKCDLDDIPPFVRAVRGFRLDRKKYKKLMFDAQEKGNLIWQITYNNYQQLKKVKANSAIGACGFEGSPFYDKEVFNGVTSSARNGVILAYTILEQLLSNNFYWNNGNKVYSYIYTTAKHSPSKEVIDYLVEKYGLYVPTNKEIVDRLLSSAKYYIRRRDISKIKDKCLLIIDGLPVHEKVYVFYRRNLLNLFEYNDTLFRGMLDPIVDIKTKLKNGEDVDVAHFEPRELFSAPESIRASMSIISNDFLDYKPINDDLIQKHPEVASKFAGLCDKMSKHLDKYEEIMATFMYQGESIAEVMYNKNIKRKSTAVSDTDSIIFTMKDPISWYLKGEARVCDASVVVASYLVHLVSIVINIAARDMGLGKGILGDRLERINFKSEFFYSVFVKTDLGKHYFGKYIAQEGRVLKVAKSDIKGVELQSSTLPEVSRKFAKDLMNTIIDEVQEHGNVYKSDIILRCMDYESDILKSLKTKSMFYYANVSVRSAEQYTKPDSSIFFNYTFWRDVFEPTYGELHIPGKHHLVPLNRKDVKSERYLNFLKLKHPDIYPRFVKFMSRVAKTKNITRIPIPSSINELPEALLPIVDFRTIIHKNLAPAALVAKQLGIHLTKAKSKPVFLDFYSTKMDVLSHTDIDEVA